MVGVSGCSYASSKFQGAVMGHRFRAFRDYTASVTSLKPLPSVASGINLLVILKPERPLLGIEQALAALEAQSARTETFPQIRTMIVLWHWYPFLEQLQMIGQTHVWLSGTGTNLMPALFLPVNAVVAVLAQPPPASFHEVDLLWQNFGHVHLHRIPWEVQRGVYARVLTRELKYAIANYVSWNSVNQTAKSVNDFRKRVKNMITLHAISKDAIANYVSPFEDLPEFASATYAQANDLLSRVRMKVQDHLRTVGSWVNAEKMTDELMRLCRIARRLHS